MKGRAASTLVRTDGSSSQASRQASSTTTADFYQATEAAVLVCRTEGDRNSAFVYFKSDVPAFFSREKFWGRLSQSSSFISPFIGSVAFPLKVFSAKVNMLPRERRMNAEKSASKQTNDRKSSILARQPARPNVCSHGKQKQYERHWAGKYVISGRQYTHRRQMRMIQLSAMPLLLITSRVATTLSQ